MANATDAMRDKIVNYIRRNRISTTEVADALGKRGVLPNLSPIVLDEFRVGPVRCVFTSGNSNWGVHVQSPKTEPSEIVIIFAHECDERAIIGDLVAKFILLYRGAEALVVDGMVRDAARLRRERFPIWCTGFSPLGCVNDEPEAHFPADREAELRQNFEGGVAICDDGGVVVIPPYCLDENMLERLERIELQEDIWAYCLNTLKWNTQEIVCERRYLSSGELLSPAHRETLSELQQRFTKKF